MSIDELVTTFTVAYWGANNGPADRTNARAGVTAIVRALRDEIDRIWTSDDMGCGTIIAVFNEILGSDAGEKVAEMPDLPTRTVQLTGITKSQRPDIQFEPATDAAPAVCEWTKGFETYENRKWWRAACGHSFYGTPTFENCKCGKPIKFTEAK
jgi:hypothetical protein